MFKVDRNAVLVDYIVMEDEKQKQRNRFEAFYAGLQELVDSTFPKTCSKCGRTYQTMTRQTR